MSSSAKLYAAISAVLVLVVAVVVWVWVRPMLSDPGDDIVAASPTPVVEPTPTPSLAERLSERLKGTTLKTSDAVVRELVGQLSLHPKVAAWLANDDLIRRFVAAVDNTANGISPTSQLDFLRPAKGFDVSTRGDETFVDPKSYTRYDLATRVFVSLDTEGSVALYRELEPLIDEAYAEISPPGSRFADRLDAAFEHLLEVTPPSGAPKVERKVVTYVYTDESLEALSGAQRQFLRSTTGSIV